jgi:hypothetical protein
MRHQVGPGSCDVLLLLTSTLLLFCCRIWLLAVPSTALPLHCLPA